MMIRVVTQLGKIKSPATRIVSEVLKLSQQIKITQYSPLVNNRLQTSKYSTLSLKGQFAYFFSQFTKTSKSTQQPQSRQVTVQPNQQQSIIDVNATRSTMLFMNTNKLSTMVRMNKIRNSLKGYNYLDNINGQTIFSQRQNDHKELSSFQQFDKRILSITKYNQYLAKGTFEDYNDYPIVKLLQICLKFLTEHHNQPQSTLYTNGKSPLQHWRSLQHIIRKRMHNCSAKDYLKIVYITLNTYSSVYKFTPQFIESLISGLRKEIPLMEEKELMQMFLIVSQQHIRGRQQWESSLRYSLTNNSSNITPKSTNYRVKSPFFEHELLNDIHQQILQKIVKRYQNKFMNTELAMKEEQIFKLVWWAQTLIAFRNQSIGHIRDNTYSNLAKNKFLVGIVNVLTSKLHPLLKNNMTHVIKGQVRQIQNKQISFKSVNEMIRFFLCLSELRDYLLEEGRSGQIYEGIDEKAKEVRLRADTWIDKSKQVNDIMMSVLQYNAVKDMISGLFNKNKIDKDKDDKDQKTQLSLNDYQKKWQLIEMIQQCYVNQAKNNSLVAIEWYIKLISEFKVFELLEKTQQVVQQSFRNLQAKRENTNKMIFQNDRERLIRLGQSQVNIVYKLFNNLTMIKKQLHSIKASQVHQKLTNTDFLKLYSGIVSSCFYLFQAPQIYVQSVRQSTLRLMDIMEPQTILNMINMEVGMIGLGGQCKEKKIQMSNVGIIIAYAQEILGKGFDSSSTYNFMYYIRELQFPIYNYFTIYLKSSPNLNSTVYLTTKHLSQTLLTRNTLTRQYLQQHNIEFQQIINPQSHNSFTTVHKFISSNNYKALATSHGLVSPKHRLLQGDEHYSRENILMGEYIMGCIKQEKKRWLRDENIVKLNKFFTQIKAFKEIRFCYPISVFMTTVQFAIVLEASSSNINKRDRYEQMSKSHLLMGLLFLPRELMMQTQLLSLKEMYKMDGIQITVLEVHEFLDMHINQRIQTLNRAIFGMSNQYNTAGNQSSKSQLQQIIDKFC